MQKIMKRIFVALVFTVILSAFTFATPAQALFDNTATVVKSYYQDYVYGEKSGSPYNITYTTIWYEDGYIANEPDSECIDMSALDWIIGNYTVKFTYTYKIF